jgi:hypothetical protein
MGGTSQSSQTQNSTTNPWAPAQPALQGILGQVQQGLGNTGVTGNENNALNTLTQNAGNASQFAPQITANAGNLLNGGGANNQAGAVNQAYLNYFNQTNPLASNTNYDPMSTPGLGQQLQTIQSDVGNAVNGQFAAAGRDFSGANQQAYGRGVAQGLAPVITDQYNRNVANQQGAAQGLLNGAYGSAGLLSGFQQQANANQQVGTQAATDAWNSQNAGANATLQAEALRRGIPVQALGLLAQIGIPIAGLGGQSTGQSNGTQQASGMQQFQQFGSGLGSIMGGLKGMFAPTPTA